MVKDESERLQQNNQNLEARYNEDQQRWSKLCERVGNQMEEHKFVYQNKFPIDPFKRDNIFHQSVVL